MIQVDWEQTASDQFAAISMAHPDRWKDINNADNDIAKKLQRDPLAHSQLISEESDPLVVYIPIHGSLVTVEAMADRMIRRFFPPWKAQFLPGTQNSVVGYTAGLVYFG